MKQTLWSHLQRSLAGHTFAHDSQRPAIDAPEKAHPVALDPLLTLLIEEAFDAMIVCDSQQRLLFWNQSAQELYGWGEETTAINRQPVHTLLNTRLEGDHTRDAEAEIADSLTSNGTWQGELIQTSCAGKQLIIHSRHILLRDDGGQNTAILQINRDITERRRAEAQREEHARLLSTANKVGFWSWNMHQKRATLSPLFRELFPAMDEEVTWEQFLSLIHPLDREKIEQNLQLIIQEHEYRSYEFRILSPRYGTRWFAESACGIYDEQGNIVHVIGVSVDITRQKQSEKDLKATNASINTILDSINGIFFFLDTDWRYVYVNQEVCQLAEKTPAELLGQSFYDIYPETIGTDIDRNHRLAMATQQPLDFETFSAGRWFAVHLSPTPQGLSVHAHDITEQRRIAQALQASESRLRRLVDANISPVVVNDLDGPIKDANDAFLELIGYTRDELQAGKINWRDLTPPEYEELDNQARQTLIETGICKRIEKEYIHKSGKRVPIAFAGARQENSNELIGFVTDLTPQRVLEKQRMQFLSMISHELKSPLTGIRGSLQLAQRRFGRLFQQEKDIPTAIEKKWLDTRELLDTAVRQTSILDRLISDLIEGARITSGQFTLALAPCDLRQIVRETVEGLRFALPNRVIELENATSQDSVFLEADADRIAQVLTNYIMNAIKYAPPSEPITIGLHADEHEATVWVRDRGPGLSPEARQHIWERFYRQPGATDHTGHGVNFGLGLFICQTIISSHHGQLGVESQPGSGSTFWFSLPRATA